MKPKKSQSLSYENSYSNGGRYILIGDSSLIITATEAHKPVTWQSASCMKKGVVCCQEVILYIVCAISAFTTHLLMRLYLLGSYLLVEIQGSLKVGFPLMRGSQRSQNVYIPRMLGAIGIWMASTIIAFTSCA